MTLLTEGIDRARLDDAGWQQLADWVGHLPLALELLNRALKAGALEPKELLARAERQGPTRELDRQMKLLERHVPPDALRGVTEAFSISYARLSRAEQRAARLIAQLAPEPIPLELLEALGPKVMPDAVRATLRSRHFITAMEAAGDVRMVGGMHRVLADYLRGQSRNSVAELRQVCRGLLVLMQPSACEDPNAWPLLKACLPHAESSFERLMQPGGRSWLEKLYLKLMRLLGISREAPADFLLGVALGLLWSAIGNATQAHRFRTRVAEHAMRVLGPKHPDTLTAMNNLAVTLSAQGDVKGAREQQERVLEVSRRVLGEEHPDTLTAMDNLAMTLREQGDLAGAEALEKEAQDIRQRQQ